MKFWGEVLTAAVMSALAVWHWVQLRRHPGDAALRILAIGVTTIAFVLTMSIDVPPLRVVDDLLSEISFSNIAWLFLFYCYSVFFLLARLTDDADERRRITRRAATEFGIYVAVLAVTLFALLTADPGFFGKNRDLDSYRSVRNVVYYLGSGVYPIVLWIVGTARAVAYLRLLRHTWARLAVAGVLVGMGMMALGVNGISVFRQGLYMTWPGSRWPELRDAYNVFRLTGQSLLAVSLAAAPLATLIVGARERLVRRHKQALARDVRPLWSTLTAEYPQVVLPTAGAGTERAPNLDRMMIEISDGLALLAPWAAANDTLHTASTADRVGAALLAKRRSEEARWTTEDDARGDEDPPQWEPDFEQQDWNGRADWMIRLSRDLERRGALRTDTAAAEAT